MDSVYAISENHPMYRMVRRIDIRVRLVFLIHACIRNNLPAYTPVIVNKIHYNRTLKETIEELQYVPVNNPNIHWVGEEYRKIKSQKIKEGYLSVTENLDEPVSLQRTFIIQIKEVENLKNIRITLVEKIETREHVQDPTQEKTKTNPVFPCQPAQKYQYRIFSRIHVVVRLGQQHQRARPLYFISIVNLI